MEQSYAVNIARDSVFNIEIAMTKMLLNENGRLEKTIRR